MGTASLRSKYRASSVEDVKKASTEEDEKISTGRTSDFLKLESGLNKLRFFPKHEGETNFLKMRSSVWLSVEKNGEMKRFPVNNAKVHGKMEKDIVEEFVKFAKTILGGGDSDDEAKLKKVLSNQNGLLYQSTWIGYANICKGENKTFGLAEIKKSVRDAMNDECVIEDPESPIETEPFTDPDSGKPALITYDPEKGKKDPSKYYKTKLSKNVMPLTDEELEKFDKVKPLSELPQFRHNIKDFEQQLEGLRNFDEEHELNLFETGEFQTVIEECRAQYDDAGVSEEDDDDKPTKKTAPAKKPASKPAKTSKKVEEEEEEVEEVEEEEEEVPFEADESEEEEADAFAGMDRSELKKYIIENSLDIKVMKGWEDEEIREKIRVALAASLEEEEEEVEEVEEEEAEEEAPKKAAPTPKKAAAGKKVEAAPGGDKKRPSIEEIKAKLAGNKK